MTTGERALPQDRTDDASEFRRRLLDGMTATIRERGFHDSTVADIVRHARTSRRTFYEHFAGKQDCLITLLHERNTGMIRDIAAAVDSHAPWHTQVRQAIEAWIASAQSEPAITVSWIREVPSLGEQARQLQRDTMEEFIVLITTLSNTADMRAAGVRPVSRQLAIMLLGGLRELIATTVEDGGNIDDIVEVAVQATTAMLDQGVAQPGA